MAKDNFSFEKRCREMEKEEKKKRKLEAGAAPAEEEQSTGRQKKLRYSELGNIYGPTVR